MRIVSLLPSATEIVYALGLGDELVAVTHECDYPPEAQSKPRITVSLIETEGRSAEEIDQQVRQRLARGESLYRMDEELLRRLEPDLILTQEICVVCAVATSEVEAVVARLPKPPRVLSLDPRRLSDMLGDLRRVAEAAGVRERAAVVLDGLTARIEYVRRVASVAQGRPCVVLLEWPDPPMCGGHWNPELIRIAGGIDPLGREGEPARYVRWDEVVAAAPDVIVVAACGCSAERTLREMDRIDWPPEWWQLPAVRKGFVYVADANAYFTRPGPRLVDSLELLASAIHPELFGPVDDIERMGRWQRRPAAAAR